MFLQVFLGITRIICTAVLLFAGLIQHHQHHLHRSHILQGLLCFCRFASASPASFAPLFCFLRVCFSITSIICTAATFCRVGLPRHHPHHLHHCFAFCGFASASPASSAPLPHSAGVLLCFCRFASASASFAPRFCFLRVCFSITSIICTAATFCRVCFVFAGFPRHHPHHLHRCFAFCGFASASPASFAPLPHSAGCCFVCAGLPRHHPHHLHRCFCFLQICFSITSIICTAATFCRVLLCLCRFITRIICTAAFAFCRFASASPASSAPLCCFLRVPASSAPLFCILRVCFSITSIICTAAAFCRDLH